jgi:ribosomal protein S27E
MTPQFFEQAMKRMVDNFGKAAYSQERVQLIWREVKDLDSGWFTRTIDSFIGDCRQAPLLPEFRNAVASERERLWRIEKSKDTREAESFMSSSFPKDDLRNIVQQIITRMTGGVSDESFDGLIKMLDNFAAHTHRVKCLKCNDTGIIFEQDPKHPGIYVRKCTCPTALNDGRIFVR